MEVFNRERQRVPMKGKRPRQKFDPERRTIVCHVEGVGSLGVKFYIELRQNVSDGTRLNR